MKRFFLLVILVFAFLLSGCGPDEEEIQNMIKEALTAIPSFTPLPTYTKAPTQTPNIVIVTVTFTPTPVQSPTPTLTPTITLTPTLTPTITPTPDPRKAEKEPGMYLVNTDILPGVWRSTGQGDDCYWAITSKTGGIIDNHFGFAGGTLYLRSTAFQVELGDDCGTWVYLGE